MPPHALNPVGLPSLRPFLLALDTHLEQYALPEPATVSITRLRDGIECQPWHRTPAELAAELLAWADTLSETVIELRRMSYDPVHVNLTGLLDHGHRITLYAQAPDTLIHGHLDPTMPHHRALLAPATLRAWAITESGVIA